MKKMFKRFRHFISWRLGWVNSKFPGIKEYWQQLYEKGGSSGPGSYSRLADFKAGFINGFIKAQDIKYVVDLGCGDGNQLSLLKIDSYIGFDISAAAVERCRLKFSTDSSKRFFLYEGSFANVLDTLPKAELALSLDVIFHLIDDVVFERYMTDLFAAATKFVIVYSSDYNGRRIFHERHRKFSDWVKINQIGWTQIEYKANPYPFSKKDAENTSESNFYVYMRQYRF